MTHQLKKLLFCCMAIQTILITPSILHAATCSNNWLRPFSQTMETEIMSASMTEYANGEKYFSMKQGWKTIHVYYLLGAVLVKGLDDKEIDFNNVFLYPMVFMQGGVLSKAFPQGPCSINQKTPIALPEAEGEITTTSQGVITYNYRLTGQANVKHFKGVVKYTLPEAAPSGDAVVTGYKLVGITKPYPVVGGKDMPATTLGELRRVLDAKKSIKDREKQAQIFQEYRDVLSRKDTTKDTMKAEEIIMAPQGKIDSKGDHELYPLMITYTKWGYVNKAGQVVIEPKFDLAHFFHGKLSRVLIDRKWGVIDKTGRFVIEPQYQEMGPFRDGLACVIKNGKKGFINESGKIIVPIEYDSRVLSEFKNGVAIILKNDKRLYIDKNGNYITEDQFCKAAQCSYRKSPHPMQKDKKWGLVNTKKEFILQPQYDHIDEEKEGLFLVKQGDLYGFIDKMGNLVTDLQFEHAYDFQDGLAGVKKNGKYGFIDKEGRFVIEPQFDGVSHFEDGIAPVAVNKKWGLIDKAGRYITEPQFESEYGHYAPVGFQYGVGRIRKNGKWGLIDRTGKILIEPQFDGDVAPSFFNGLGTSEFARVSKGSKHGVIHKSGKIIVPLQYDSIIIYPNYAHPDAPNIFQVTRRFPLNGYADTSGNVFVMTDKVCGQYVVKNRKGEITWPRNIKELCRQ